MSRDTAVPFWRRRIVWLVGVLVLSLIYVLFRSCRDVTGEARLRDCALEFLEAADAGDYENCRKAGTMKDRDLHVFRLNRESLGKLVKRTPGRVTPLRFGDRGIFLPLFPILRKVRGFRKISRFLPIRKNGKWRYFQLITNING